MNGLADAEFDPWHDDDHAVSSADAEWARLRDRYTNAGYREGITAGKLSTVQSGFDAGYSAGAQAGRELGNLRGTAAYLLAKLLSGNAPADRIERCRELVRDLGRFRGENLLGPDFEAIAHAREHGEVDVDELTGEMATMGSRPGPTVDECKQRLDQLIRELDRSSDAAYSSSTRQAHCSLSRSLA